MKLFNDEKIDKFFKLLSTKGRMISKLYSVEGNSKCEKEVFVRRALKHLEGKTIILYHTNCILDYLTYSTWDSECWSLENKHPIVCKRYISVNNISYYLGHGEDLEIGIYDWNSYPSGFKNLKLNSGKIKSLEGIFTEDKSFIETIKSLSDLDLPEQEFTFKAYDWEKYPKRVKKDTDVMEKLKIPIIVKAKTLNLAYNEIKKLIDKKSKIQYTFDLF